MKVTFAFISALGLANALPASDVLVPETNELVTRAFGAQGNLFNSTAAFGPFINLLKEVEKKASHAVKEVLTKTIFPPTKFQGWKTYKSNGVNLGGWLVLEKGIEPGFFNNNGASEAIDEDSFCKVLGKKKCGQLLDHRYATFFTEADIDKYVSYGVNTIRIPVGYWAFMPALEGDNYYTGRQLFYMSKIADYAIRRGMHVVLDLHGLPGGQNGLDNQGKTNQLDWWHNEANFAATLKLVGLATDYILRKPNSNQWTLGLINEPIPELYHFGQTDDSFAYLNKFYTASLDIIRKKSQNMQVMLSDGFSGPQTWDQWWANTPNIVIDTHIYFFQSGGGYSFDAAYSGCYLAQSYQVATNPVFIGEWSIQAAELNNIKDDSRKKLFQSQYSAYMTYLNGGAFWNAKHFGTNIVGDDNSTQEYYWSWEQIAKDGIALKPGEELTAFC